MKSGLQAGTTVTRRMTVDEPCTVVLLGESLRVYATPELVRAPDGAEEISRGEHGRFIVEVAKLRARLAAKADA